MSGCLFWAKGEEFDVDAFLLGSSLLPDQVYHRGEIMLAKQPDRLRSFSGFHLVASETWGCLEPQIKDVIEFLREHELELSRLAHYPGVTQICLDFPYERRQGAVTQTDSLPPELLLLAGSLGISIDLTLYPHASDELAPDPQAI